MFHVEHSGHFRTMFHMEHMSGTPKYKASEVQNEDNVPRGTFGATAKRLTKNTRRIAGGVKDSNDLEQFLFRVVNNSDSLNMVLRSRTEPAEDRWPTPL